MKIQVAANDKVNLYLRLVDENNIRKERKEFLDLMPSALVEQNNSKDLCKPRIKTSIHTWDLPAFAGDGLHDIIKLPSGEHVQTV